MNIALIAHDAKKELLVQFCIAYCGIISRHDVCATGTTGKLVSEATGLKINCFLAGSQGGGQQIASRIACNEIDLLIFFRDPLSPKRLPFSIEASINLSLLRHTAVWASVLTGLQCLSPVFERCRRCSKFT